MRLPPLNALRAFEATARQLSFSHAAEELNVTPGAVSQQIKQLEDYLEVRLFERHKRQIALTDAGRTLLPQLSEAFAHIRNAVEDLQRQQQDEPLNITAPPSFVSKWLIPRLSRFNDEYPDINVRIDASVRLVDLEHENIDVGIRFSEAVDPALETTHLMALEVIPVCSPAYLERHPEIRDPRRLNEATLLHYENPLAEITWPDWGTWLATVGIEGIDTMKGIFINQTDLLIEAALEGQGVALIATIYADSEIRGNRLVQPFGSSMPIRFSYYLVTTAYKAKRQRVQLFREWILEQSRLPLSGA
jgi:LysR family glycine cleavage system transcriptional activator